MKLEDICVSLELAKELKANNYPQESLFYWWIYTDNTGKEYLFVESEENVSEREAVASDSGTNWNPVKICAAPTLSELGENLPIDLGVNDGMRFDLNIYRDGGGDWVVCYWWDEDSRRLTDLHIDNITDKKEVIARAKMWLYLKKEGLL